MHHVLFALALVACSFQHGRLPGANDPDAQLDDGGIDAPDAAIAPIDTDGDGVLDPDDNCPELMNADQRNHDADPRGDVCDLCPHIGSTTDLDGDGDGVGNDCDPRPSASGDQFRLFTGFYAASDTAGWGVGGTWTYDGMTARQMDAIGIHYLSPTTTYARASVQAGVTLDSLPGTSGTSAAIIGSGSSTDVLSPGIVHWCAIISDGNGQLLAQTKEGSDDNAVVNWPEPYEGVSLQLAINLSSDTWCKAVRNGTTQVTLARTPTTSGRVVLISQRAELRFDYLFVVETGS